ncbi:MAG TPA: MarR family transcriptional regulator [Acidimicrobiales bacterium]|nr:MarR family transcriptional regulator [Acidimicrobiales bacterium]
MRETTTGEGGRAVDELTEALGRLCRQGSLPRFSDHVARHAGTPLDRSAFLLLARLGTEQRRIGQLAEELSVDVSTVSRQVQGLEDAGFVSRHPHPTDRRACLIAIEDAGRTVLAAHRRARREVFAELLADQPDEDIERIAAFLGELATRLEARVGP